MTTTTTTKLSRGEQLLLDLIRREHPLAIVGELRSELDATQAAFDACLLSLSRQGLVVLHKHGGGTGVAAAPAGSLEHDGRTYHVASLR